MLKKSLFLSLFSVVVSLTAQTKLPIYQDNTKSVEQRVNNLCSLMTLDEKADFLAGKDDWHFKGIERLGVPAMQVTDCGHGVTIVFDKQGNWVGNATCFPTAVQQAATWNRALVSQVGAALGREARATGSSILLAPMINIKRTPLGGRNYEVFSEDPLLTGEMAAAFINGVQSEKIGAVVKSMAVNNQQAQQEHLMAHVDERTLQEIYLPGFRIAVEKSNPWGVMTAYNGLNGYRTSASEYLLQQVLKKDWNYNGFVVSDWRAVQGIESIWRGCDIEMPGPGKYMTKVNVLKAIDEKRITLADLDEKVKRILRAYIKSTQLDSEKQTLKAEINTEKHQLLTRKVAEEGIVLLKNNNNLLPLDLTKIKKLGVIGPNATTARLGGGGSASVSAFYTVSPLDGLRKLCGTNTEIVYQEGCGLDGNLNVVDGSHLRNEQNGIIKNGLKSEYFRNRNLAGEPTVTSIDELVNFSWGWANPKPEISRNGYSVRWSGQLIPPTTGDYKLGISAGECGYRLYLNGKLEIDEWETGGKDNFEAHFTTSKRQIAVRLEEGKPADIKIEFWKRMNRNFIRFEWETPGTNPVQQAANLAKECDAVVIFAGLSNFFEGGNNDRKEILLPGEQNRLIAEVTKANHNTVVVLVNGSAVAMPWVNDVNAIVEAYYPGQEGGNAIANILTGVVNPSGKLPETFAKKLSDTPSFKYYNKDSAEVTYTEGIYVGYRHYDKNNIEPLFPFGHGLSYTNFTYSDLKIKKKRSNIIVTFNITNTGNVDGAEVAQLYIKDVKASEDRPEKELKNFEKVFLKKGETKTLSMEITKQQLAFFSKVKHKWVNEAGQVGFLVGSSSRDIRLKTEIKF
ncbi:MAG: glycoside hydrolase family 3 C-terminal domain-containing protein [Bacteroidales bacterium]|nr:glycoside hydrolase family 3 C-terminal domain-containing protein [Bacteroidales bacterium]